LFAKSVILLFVGKWCTVTVTEPEGRRHSLDVLAESTYDAAHLFVVEAKKERAVGLPKPTLSTIFEVVASGKVYRVAGVALQRWIVERRQKWHGPKGYMFCKRRIGMTATSGCAGSPLRPRRFSPDRPFSQDLD
jgi:hypothetical protein